MKYKSDNQNTASLEKLKYKARTRTPRGQMLDSGFFEDQRHGALLKTWSPAEIRHRQIAVLCTTVGGRGGAALFNGGATAAPPDKSGTPPRGHLKCYPKLPSSKHL
jgi:hypothetical protein